MSITSLLWKSVPKKNRSAMLGTFDAINQYPLNKLLSDDTELPKDFVDLNCIFIHIPKCAGTTVKEALFPNKVHSHMPIWFYEKCFSEFYNNAYKFTFVRHPLDRAYSAYCYAYNSDISRNSSIKEVVRHYADFDSFVQNWMSPDNIKKHVIFNPQVDFLKNSMGLINIDFIGKHESFNKDFLEVSEKLGKEIVAGHHNASAREVSPHFSKKTIDKVYDLYDKDFEFFEYK
jgi:hypothetical protein